MTWNYRIIEKDGVFFIGEVYYNKDDEPAGYVAGVEVSGDTREELADVYERMGDVFAKPVLRADVNDHLTELQA